MRVTGHRNNRDSDPLDTPIPQFNVQKKQLDYTFKNQNQIGCQQHQSSSNKTHSTMIAHTPNIQQAQSTSS